MAELADAKDFILDKKFLGPYINNHGRQFVVIKTKNGYKTISYPRYLMEQKLGRPLAPKEDVHHIDGNYLNNDLSNLEIKMHGEHQKEHGKSKQVIVVKVCYNCGKAFVLTKNQRTSRHTTERYFCSRRCGAIWGRREQLIRNGKIECK